MNRVNALTAERVEEQRELADYILEGNMRVIECIQAVQNSIKNGEKPQYTPLARISYQEKHKETLDMMQKPIPPKRTYEHAQEKKTSPELESLYEELTQLRNFVESVYSEGIAGRKELELVTDRLYQLQNRLYLIASR